MSVERVFAETFELGPTNGRDTLAGARKELFKLGLSNPTNHGVCRATPRTLFAVHGLTKDGTYQEIFESLHGADLKRFWWTEGQVVAICRIYRRLFGRRNIFLCEGKDCKPFVTYISLEESDGMRAYDDPFDLLCVHGANKGFRIFVPQL